MNAPKRPPAKAMPALITLLVMTPQFCRSQLWMLLIESSTNEGSIAGTTECTHVLKSSIDGSSPGSA